MSRHDEPTRALELDILAIAADDAALDAFAVDDAVSWDTLDPALQILGVVHQDVSLELPAPSTSWGEAAVDLRPPQRSRRAGRRAVVASAITAAVLSVSGVAAAGIVSGPGGPLYPIHQLFLGSEPTASQHAAGQVRHFLHQAGKDLAGNRLTAAGSALGHASSWLAGVDVEDRGDLPAQLAAMQSRYDDALAAADPSKGSHGQGGTGDHGAGNRGDTGGSQGSGSGSGDSSGKGGAPSGAGQGDRGKSGSQEGSSGSGSAGPSAGHSVSGSGSVDSSGSGDGVSDLGGTHPVSGSESGKGTGKAGSPSGSAG